MGDMSFVEYSARNVMRSTEIMDSAEEVGAITAYFED